LPLPFLIALPPHTTPRQEWELGTRTPPPPPPPPPPPAREV
ncbi:hypothetical protein ACFDR9_004268, partial [Janthinobacterium sp. CG_23.3]